MMATMSDSSPMDLAIMFRSLPRRLSDARGDVAASAISGQLAAIDQRLARAAQVLKSDVDPLSIADAINAVPADAWGSELDELRRLALDLGKDLRAVAAENPEHEG